MEQESISITLIDLPEGMKAWLKATGKPNYRSVNEQAAYLCASYLTGVFKRAQAAAKNGVPATAESVSAAGMRDG